jgi:hypothetical protein
VPTYLLAEGFISVRRIYFPAPSYIQDHDKRQCIYVDPVKLREIAEKEMNNEIEKNYVLMDSDNGGTHSRTVSYG